MPNLESIWWVSAIGAVCSYTYSSIALGLSIFQVGMSVGVRVRGHERGDVIGDEVGWVG